MANICWIKSIASALAVLAIVAPKKGATAPQTLDCVLTDIETKSAGVKFDSEVAAEKRSIAVIFDDDAKTLAMKGDSSQIPLKNVAISQTSMTGASDIISLGIDRSSWHIVFQTFGQGTTRNEFGECSFRP